MIVQIKARIKHGVIIIDLKRTRNFGGKTKGVLTDNNDNKSIIIPTQTSVTDTRMLNNIDTVHSTLQKLSRRIVNATWKYRVTISVFCHDCKFFYLHLEMAGYLDYDIVAHNTAQKPVNFVFISGHFRFHGSKPFQVVGCVCFFCCLTSHYCMLMSVSDTVSLRMWHSTSLLWRHSFDIS